MALEGCDSDFEVVSQLHTLNSNL